MDARVLLVLAAALVVVLVGALFWAIHKAEKRGEDKALLKVHEEYDRQINKQAMQMESIVSKYARFRKRMSEKSADRNTSPKAPKT